MNDEPIYPHDIAEMDEAFGRVRLRIEFPKREDEHFMDLRPNGGVEESQGNDQ